ncbi:MAG: pectinesterase family protein [Prolixibacteraceae bacterium]|jgi:pectinesterase|nr:pectinesterase family protein [Prolixibacteraceae bacterium]
MNAKSISTVILLFLFLIPFGTKAAIEYDLYVAKDGSTDFTSIQEAINATKSFPDKRVTIHIKSGVYIEKIRVYSWNNKLTLKGEDTKNTIITYDDYFGKINRGRNSTFHTYTLKVEANDVIVENLTIENTAGSVGQAVALHVEGDRCQFVNCRITGNQDTAYLAGEGSRQYFKNCYIDGTTDFIFGEATVIFDKCEIHSKSDSYITAASTPKNILHGFVFMNCKLTAAENVDKVLLGRPWRDYASVIFMNCEMGSHIAPQGWSNWSKTNRDQTAFYAEYANTGPGADTSERLPWTNTLTRKQAKKHSIDKIFSSNEIRSWKPSYR